MVGEEEVVEIGREIGMWGEVIRIDLRSGARAGIEIEEGIEIAAEVRGGIGRERGVGVGVLIRGVGVGVAAAHRLGGVAE